jgi:release factor glutamine methyltransferase
MKVRSSVCVMRANAYLWFMAEKLQTISDIQRHLSLMLGHLWPPKEAAALASSIIMEFTGMNRGAQLAFGDRTADRQQLEKILAAAGRAAAGEPLQYILGYTIFCGERIEVGNGVLIPRPETEEMTAMIIEENPFFSGTVTDLCTGSGCIAIALSGAFPEATVVAVENSPPALRTAARNIQLTGTSVQLIEADILSQAPETVPMSDIIVSNPPYVRRSEMGAMHPNVREYEPHEALFVPDNDPLLYYRAIAAIADARLEPGGVLWLEVNEQLAAETASLLCRDNYENISIIKDIREKERFIKAVRHGRQS